MSTNTKHPSKQTSSVMDKSLLSLTWPIFIDTLMVFLINVADAWFLSQQSDESAAAVGAVLPITGMCFGLFVAINAAGTSVAAKHFGLQSQSSDKAENNHLVSLTFGAILVLCFITGLFISALLLLFNENMSSLMGLTGGALEDASIYLHTLGFAALALSIRFGASAILQSFGKTQWNMFCTGIMTLVNLFFNYAFMYGAFGMPQMGVKGIAMATNIAWIVNLILTFVVIYYLGIHYCIPKTIQSLKKSTKSILDIAIPSAIEPQAWQLSQLVIMGMIVNMGSIALATRVYVFNIIFIVLLFTISLSAGVQLKVAYLYGAKQYKDMHNTLIKGVLQGLGLVLLTITILYVFSDQLIGLFSQNPEILKLSSIIIAVAVFTELGRVLNMVIGFSVKVVGHAKFIAVFGISTMWIISLPFTWFLGVHLGYGLIGIWIAMGADECFRGSVATWFWLKKQKERAEVIEK